jgi:hypothetical protein
MTSRGPRTDLSGCGSSRSGGLIAGQTLLLLTALGVGIAPARAQTIQPVVVEYRQQRAEGRFELVNDGHTPLTVVLEPRSFDVTHAGDPVYRPLDPRIHVRLSTMSLRIPARQTRVVFYEASADSLPAWFTIACTFAGLRVRSGLEVRVELPHTVYLLQKRSLASEDVGLALVSYDATTRQVAIELENSSARVGRALEAEVIGPGHRERVASFPMMPRGHRQVLLPWNAARPPDRVVVHFPGFTLERSFREGVTAGN